MAQAHTHHSPGTGRRERAVAVMDFAALHEVTRRAGFRIDWDALLRLSAAHPEPVQDWVAAAGEYAAAEVGQRLLSVTAATLRDLIAGTPTGHLYQHADQLAEVCDLLTGAEQARAEAMDQLTGACLDLAALEPTALTRAPDTPAGPPPAPHQHTPTTPTAGGRPCRGTPRRSHRRPHRPT